jgi:hypothetical protein
MLTYDEIKATALDYADRADDTDVVNRLDAFLRVVEARVNRVLQTGRQSKRSHIYTNSGHSFYALPDDFAGMRSIVLKTTTSDNSGIILDYVVPEVMNTHINQNRSNGVYTIIGCSLQVWPVTDNYVLEIVYYQQLVPLSSTVPENWLTRMSPDAYIQGLLVEINSFVRDQEAALLWDGRFKQTLVDMQYEDDIDRWSGPAPAVRLM